MHIILNPDDLDAVSDRYIVLELDTFRVPERTEPVTAWALIENVPIQDLGQAHNLQDLHQNLIVNYRKANWSFCEQALEHLIGHWNGEIDSFYLHMRDRVRSNQGKGTDDWSAEMPVKNSLTRDTVS